MYLFLVSFLPVFLLCLYIYNKDKNKEPKRLLVKLFLLGVISCIPAFLLELFFLGKYDIDDMNFVSLFFYSFCGIAFIEELCKFVVTYYISYNHKEFDEMYDIIVYATFVSLGFAFLENYCYVSLYGYLTGLFRAVFSVPFHACSGVIMGYYLSISKNLYILNDFKNEKKYVFLGLFMPVLIHGFYDFCIFSSNLLFFVILLVYVIYIFIHCFSKINSVSKENLNYNNNKTTILR